MGTVVINTRVEGQNIVGIGRELAVDLSKLQLNVPTRSRETEPEAIFEALTLRGSVENIWAPQAEALRRWHEGRQAEDTIIEMNTGGGKTLVGLLIAQSLVNETRGRILYVCPTNQLVEQTAERAAECGIETATYMKRTWQRRQVYERCTGPCLTNYAALFNGLSVFRQEDLKGIIFDDAHVAGDIIRDQFTIRIKANHEAFRPLVDLFRSYFVRNLQLHSIDAVIHGDPFTLLFVPMFEVSHQRDRLRQVLLEHGIEGSVETKLPWMHLQAHLHCCVVLLSGAGAEITPPVLPVHTLAAFQEGTRRVYMTATLPLQTEFLRTFGVKKANRITPSGKLGEAQRQFIFCEGETDEEQRERAQALVADRKACIITPSARSGEQWCPPAFRYESAHGHTVIQSFAQSAGKHKMVLAGLYDGIDLPGDACRVLVLEGVPEAASLFERFLDQSLKVERLRAAHTSRRIVQAMGRIFRSNTDHGAIIVCGGELQRWVENPGNQSYLPRLLQQQVQLGLELRREVDAGKVTYEYLLSAVLTGRQDWDELYRNYIGMFETATNTLGSDWLSDLVIQESQAYDKLWVGNYMAAAHAYGAAADAADPYDSSLAAWYRHWEGLAYELARKPFAAEIAYVQAVNMRAELGRLPSENGMRTASEEVEPSPQAQRIAALLKTKQAQIGHLLDDIQAKLDYGDETRPAEQALHDIGLLLGLEASRPDNSDKTGPDVLWRHPTIPAAVIIEAKTNKRPEGRYRKKDDIGHVHDHVQWFSDHYPGCASFKVIVGRKLPVTPDANPPEDLRIIPLEAFH